MLKLLEAEWACYLNAQRESAAPPADPRRLGGRMEVEEELRRAFFGGALAVFRIVRTTGALDILAMLNAELSAYSDAELHALAARLSKEAGFDEDPKARRA